MHNYIYAQWATLIFANKSTTLVTFVSPLPKRWENSFNFCMVPLTSHSSPAHSTTMLRTHFLTLRADAAGFAPTCIEVTTIVLVNHLIANSSINFCSCNINWTATDYRALYVLGHNYSVLKIWGCSFIHMLRIPCKLLQ